MNGTIKKNYNYAATTRISDYSSDFDQIGDFCCAYNKEQKQKPGKFMGITYPYAAPEWIASVDDFIPTAKCDVYR